MATGYWSQTSSDRISRRRVLAAGGGLSAALLLAACSGNSGNSTAKTSSGPADKSGLVANPADSSKQAQRGGLYRTNVTADVATFDLHQAVPGVENAQFDVYDRLMQPKPGVLKDWQGEFEGDLTESWEVSADKLQMTLRLRQGVKWHNKPPVDGRLFDADDVVTSWERFVVKGNSSAIANAKNPNAPILSMTATDSKTVVVKMKEPVANLVAIFAQPRTSYMIMFPKEIDKTWDVRRDMLGTGPFVLTDYQPSVGYKYKRNPDYFDSAKRPYVEDVEMPIITEYAQALAQLKAGNLHSAAPGLIRAEDILPTKRDVPKLNMFAQAMSLGALSSLTAFGWLAQSGKSPFLDERVRQAYSMSIDRDLWINTFFNVDKFQAEGLPVSTAWSSHVSADLIGWLDPKSKDFGPNATYFAYNTAEAKKLLAAAGHANGLDVVSHVPALAFGPNYPKEFEVLTNMSKDAGFRPTTDAVANLTDFNNKYGLTKGLHEGWIAKLFPSYAVDALASLRIFFDPNAGDGFAGIDDTGKGDPQVQAMFAKALAEFDNEKRKAIVFDLQRYLAKSMYAVKWPGGATGFNLVAPEIQNWNVFRWPDLLQSRYIWVDDTKRR